MFGQGHVFLVRLIRVKARIVAAKRLPGTRVLPGGGHALREAAD
jgi:hypothetical protein